MFKSNCDFPLIDSEVFDRLVSRLIQVFQPDDFRIPDTRIGYEVIELPSQWRKYGDIESSRLVFCAETGLLIWIQGILLKYAVDVGLVETSLFESQDVRRARSPCGISSFCRHFFRRYIWRERVLLVVEKR